MIISSFTSGVHIAITSVGMEEILSNSSNQRNKYRVLLIIISPLNELVSNQINQEIITAWKHKKLALKMDGAKASHLYPAV